MTGDLSEADRNRISHNGVVALTTELALELFDSAMRGDLPVIAPVQFDLVALRTRAEAGLVPPVLRGLAGARRQAGGTSGPAVLIRKLAGRGGPERRRILLDLVRAHVAVVLGYPQPALVDAARGFLDLGFESLTAVELRNRLSRATGLRLPATLLFDHPNTLALAEHLDERLAGGDDARPAVVDLDRLEADLTATGPEHRVELTARLRDILVRITAVPVTGSIATSTDDEIFDFIDNELGLAKPSSDTNGATGT
jgi:acyl carrier protein